MQSTVNDRRDTVVGNFVQNDALCDRDTLSSGRCRSNEVKEIR